jgi:hypothetical protein
MKDLICRISKHTTLRNAFRVVSVRSTFPFVVAPSEADTWDGTIFTPETIRKFK